jgi:TAP42-like family
MLGQGMNASGMFSSNESLEDLATRHLPYLLVKYVAAEMEGRIKTTNREERMKSLGNSQVRCLTGISNEMMTLNWFAMSSGTCNCFFAG